MEECGRTTLEIAKIEGGGDQIYALRIMNGLENIDLVINIVFNMTTYTGTRGHDFTLEIGQSRLDVESIISSRKPLMSGSYVVSSDCGHSSSILTCLN